MQKQTSDTNVRKHNNITIALAMVMFILLSAACSGRKKIVSEAITERDSLPVMETKGVTTLISDSGIIRYRLQAEKWEIFDKKKPPYWAFEEGIYLETFDTLFQMEANIVADTAYYFEKQKLWKLMGNVIIRNLKGEKFNTELLFWDQNTEKVYSDRFIRIEQPDRIITGRGFESNQEMTKYSIHKPEGIFYMEDDGVAVVDTTKNTQTN
ncbi:MAG: LPS export ABC transporter periplasmic protein LptC [Mediterranea massiliensis]|nr:LPS export ABC transporter periplasmic protein LptC [Mediterranea massiliensis]MBR4047936.1 LPS export ABC transporter periplasmic protein LptC [Bacteroides sp.]